MIILTVIGQWRYILNMIHEISSALSIRIFCVKDKQAYIVSDKIFSDSIQDSQSPANKEPHYELPDLQDTDNLDESENADGVWLISYLLKWSKGKYDWSQIKIIIENARIIIILFRNSN